MRRTLRFGFGGFGIVLSGRRPIAQLFFHAGTIGIMRRTLRFGLGHFGIVLSGRLQISLLFFQLGALSMISGLLGIQFQRPVIILQRTGWIRQTLFQQATPKVRVIIFGIPCYRLSILVKGPRPILILFFLLSASDTGKRVFVRFAVRHRTIKRQFLFDSFPAQPTLFFLWV